MPKKETATTATATAPKSEPSAAMKALFAAPAGFKPEGLKRRNLPRIMKPGNVPVGGCVSGKIVEIVKSPSSTVKGFLLYLKHETGEEFLFPCTGAIRQALAPGREKDSNELKLELDK